MSEKLLRDCSSIGTEIGILRDAGLTTAEAIEVLKLIELRVISNTLGECICTNGNNHFLCITGNVSTN